MQLWSRIYGKKDRWKRTPYAGSFNVESCFGIQNSHLTMMMMMMMMMMMKMMMMMMMEEEEEEEEEDEDDDLMNMIRQTIMLI